MSKEDPCALDDTVMKQRFEEIVVSYGIEVIVETGVFHGQSTKLFADMVPLVYAIDNNINNMGQAIHRVVAVAQKTNVAYLINNSPLALKSLMPHLPDKTLFFLDAHWEAYWPLLDEIDTIRRGAGIIVLHDMVVPDHPELGYDVYGGQPLDYEYVKDALTRWSPSHRVEYNSVAEGTDQPRGVGYIFPK